MNNIYSIRSSFEIARNDDGTIKLLGIWYRSNPMEYFVIAPELPHVDGERKPDRRSRGFTDHRQALDYFEQLTA